MTPATLIALLEAAAQTAKALAPIVEDALEVAGSDDAGQIKAALAELQARNDALHQRAQAKLRG